MMQGYNGTNGLNGINGTLGSYTSDSCAVCPWEAAQIQVAATWS